jgi:hypothetical protein
MEGARYDASEEITMSSRKLTLLRRNGAPGLAARAADLYDPPSASDRRRLGN